MIDRVPTRRVVRPNHPFFLRCPRAWLALAVALWSAGGLPASAATNSAYRLAGVVAVGEEYIGLLEIRPGEQVLVRKGSELPGGGRVTAFDGKTVRIALPGKVIELALDGTVEAVMTPGIVVAQENVDHVHVRNVEVDTLRAALREPAPGNQPQAAEAIQRRGRSDAGAEVARRFSTLVDLPPRSRVVAVNEIPVTDAAAAIRLVDSTLADGMPARLNITAPMSDGEQRVYLLPEQD